MNKQILTHFVNNSKLTFFFLYLSLIFGFYFNEDLAGGAIQDFGTYANIILLFEENLTLNFMNYSDSLNVDHSPFFFVFLKFLKILQFNLEFNFLNFYGPEFFFNLGLGYIANNHENLILIRFVYLHISLLSIYALNLCLKEKYKYINTNQLFFISTLLLLSPYFRSYSIWAGDLNLALVFILFAFYYFFRIIIIKPIRIFKNII